MKFKSLYNFCKSKNDSFLFVFIRHIYYKLRYNKELLISNGVRISHPQNINMNGGRIEIGFIYPEFVVKEDKTLLLCEGTFRTEGLCLINKGSRIAVTKDGVLTLRSCFINSNVKILCEHSISIGEGTAIGWGSQICDDNYHVVKYANENISTPTKAFAGGGEYR